MLAPRIASHDRGRLVWVALIVLLQLTKTHHKPQLAAMAQLVKKCFAQPTLSAVVRVVAHCPEEEAGCMSQAYGNSYGNMQNSPVRHGLGSREESQEICRSYYETTDSVPAMTSETWFCGLGPFGMKYLIFLSLAIFWGVWGMTSSDFCCVAMPP